MIIIIGWMDEIYVEKKYVSIMWVCFLFCKWDYCNFIFIYMLIKIKVKLWVGLLVCCCCFFLVVWVGLMLCYKMLILWWYKEIGVNIVMFFRERILFSEIIKSVNCFCERKLKVGFIVKII